jgi:hypothetical protein
VNPWFSIPWQQISSPGALYAVGFLAGLDYLQNRYSPVRIRMPPPIITGSYGNRGYLFYFQVAYRVRFSPGKKKGLEQFSFSNFLQARWKFFPVLVKAYSR